MRMSITRAAVIFFAAAAVFLPLGLVAYQSVLSAPFFMPASTFTLDAFRFVLADPEFWSAVRNSLMVAAGMVVISVPIGSVIAFLITRTDLPARKAIEPFILLPILIPSVVLALGYVVAAGPVGFYSVWFRGMFGFLPWNIYAPVAIAVIGGLSHVPYVYLYTSTALRTLASDVEEAARSTGASPFRVAADVNLPMIRPALMFSSVLIFFAGIEMFGLALVLGNPTGFNMLAVYLYKLTSRLGVPAYHLMAAVAVCMVFMTFPLVMLQRYLLRSGERYVAIRGKAGRNRLVPLGKWRWIALGFILAWLFVTAFVPVSGITLRAFVTHWGPDVSIWETLTLDHMRQILSEPPLMRGIRNSVLIGVIGGAFAVACYAAIALATHRYNDRATKFLDYLILVPRAVPGLLAGLAFLWVFIFFVPLTPFRSTLFSVWLAYMVVWLAYGTRLVSTSLAQVGRELEEAARNAGASRGRTTRDVTLPLVRYGLLASWLLVFLMFEREYSAGVYLLTSGTEVIGALLVTLSETGAMDQVAALSFVNLVLIGAGVSLALRFGVRLDG